MIAQRWHAPMLALALALGFGAAQLFSARHGGMSEATPSCGAGGHLLRRVELVFGLSRPSGEPVGEDAWSAFLAREVTPRFPDGFTVLSAGGQWRNAAGVIVKEPSRVILIWAQPAADLEARIETIRSAWKAEQHQESVLRAVRTDCVAF